jgi:hypothetical protein
MSKRIKDYVDNDPEIYDDEIRDDHDAQVAHQRNMRAHFILGIIRFISLFFFGVVCLAMVIVVITALTSSPNDEPKITNKPNEMPSMCQALANTPEEHAFCLKLKR